MYTRREMLHELWKAACKFDGLPTDSKFVVFSEKNKAAKMYNDLVLQVMAGN